MARVNLSETFGWRFWLNYVINLLLTCWIPLARLEFRVEETGELVNTSYLPMYQIYYQLLTSYNAGYWKYALGHLLGVLAITALVWYLVAWRSAARDAESTE